MVPREDHVDSGFFSRSHRPPQVRIIGVLGLQLNSDPNWAVGVRQFGHKLLDSHGIGDSKPPSRAVSN